MQTAGKFQQRRAAFCAARPGSGQAGWQPSPGVPNRAHSTIAVEAQLAHAMPLALPISQARIQPDGTLLAVQGIVSAPPRVFGERVIFVQDVDGAGLAVYLQRGSFPALAPGQRVTMFGYLRTRSDSTANQTGAGNRDFGLDGIVPRNPDVARVESARRNPALWLLQRHHFFAVRSTTHYAVVESYLFAALRPPQFFTASRMMGTQ